MQIYRHLTVLSLVFVLLMTAPQVAGAQAQPKNAPDISLGLQEAIELALGRNLGLQRAATQVTLGEATVEKERADFYPNLNLSLSPDLQFGSAFDPITAELDDEQTTSLGLRASSSINLFNGFADVNSLDAARYEYEVDRLSFERSEESTVYQTAAQFLDVLLAGELVRVETENVEAQRRQIEQIEAFYEAGNRPIADVLQQRAVIAQSEQRVIAAERSLRLAELNLKQTLNFDPQTTVRFEVPSESFVTALATEAPLETDALFEQALAVRDDLEAQRFRIEAAEEVVQVAKAGYYPTIALNLSTGTNYSSRSDAFGFTNQLYDVNPSGTVGLSVSIPLFDRKQTSTNVEQTSVALTNEQLALESLTQEVVFGVEQALLDIETAEAQLRTAEAQLQAAEQSLDAAEARYDVGASTLVEVSQARSLLVEAASQRAEALYDLLTARLTLAYQTGNTGTFVAALR